ncbi:XRE family transcriptional regulator [Lactococcus raffinolactis]|uniref:helix-turn-helix domain-containing protein n=1 Tax=Pseudolactococcus raffinolactis TaxID=1366 RepID=UPI001C70811D|nr:helix-turn-helix domain-containing protein [Lactococcus raffinolactis]MBW9298285.1 XRE family transcriptional regulator [Lactococcus raffinolactis]
MSIEVGNRNGKSVIRYQAHDELIWESYNFSNYLKSIRKDKGLTLKELADKSGTSDSYLSQLENGRRNPPKPKLLKLIANALSDGEVEGRKRIYTELSLLAGYTEDDERQYDTSRRKGDGMLLKDLIEKIGYSVDEFKVEALPMLAEAYENMSKISKQKEIIELIHGKHRNKKETEK